ncbi:MAG: methyltransferase domain-containing protein [Deltaproteobacteria bacterium]|nr:methyltransferase domain-containing protein [Deltaproteobacteria bacterium]
MPNAEAIEAWNTVLFDKFVQFRDLLVTNLGIHGVRAIERLAPSAGERIVDLGCGFGDTTIELARRVGPTGRVVGIDAAPRFIEAARAEAAHVANASFDVADVQARVPGGPFDAAYSRMGMMFFASPVIALRNVRAALRSGGRLCMVVWRSKAANEGVAVSEQVVRDLLGDPDKGDQITCGPGPFSMASADVVSDQLAAAGFTDIGFSRSDAPMRLGNNVDAATEFALSLGPAGELVRLAGEAGIARRAEIETAIRAVLAPFVRADGVFAGSSTWIVTATAP